MQQEGIHYIGAELRQPYMPETATMKVMPGDDLLADHRFVPDMIKIDVEGFEQRVLAGLTNTLDRFRPDLHIEVPWTPAWHVPVIATGNPRHAHDVWLPDVPA